MNLYFYNGVKFTTLLNWDKETYPYAQLYGFISDGYIYIAYLFVSTTPEHYYSGAGLTKKAYADAGGSRVSYVFDAQGTDDNYNGISWERSEAYDKSFEGGEAYSANIPGGSSLVWTNYDKFDRYTGEIYLAASEPIPILTPVIDPLSMWLGYQAGQWVVRQRGKKKTPVAYLYNGVRLPALPEWDKTVYPYAVICHYSTDALVSDSYVALLYVCENPITAISIDQITKFGDYISGKYQRYTWISDERLTELSYENGLTDAWGYDGEEEVESHKMARTITWTNHDIVYTDKDGIKKQASDPVPVYE